MKTKLTILLFLSLYSISHGQINIKGVVLSENRTPLEGASVFLNNTTIGSISDANGEFTLRNAKEGKYMLIIAYLGYKTVQHEITLTKEKPLQKLSFILIPENDMLDEVVIRKKRRSSRERITDFKRFRNIFIGMTKFAEKCTIENPEVLNYYYDKESEVFSVEADKPIIITNKALGYKIRYTLEKFEQSKKRSEYFGFTQYEELKGSKRRKRKWKKNRQTAYQGSRMHFLRSLILANTREEGFIIDQFTRIPNKKFPTEKELKFAKRIFKMYRDNNSPFSLHKKITKPKSKLDSAILIDRRLGQRKVIDSIISKDINYSDVTFKLQEKTFLRFNDILKVTYTREKEEYGYRRSKERLNYQKSNLHIIKNPELILPFGEFSNPSNHLVEGYWGYEKFANALPLNYQSDN